MENCLGCNGLDHLEQEERNIIQKQRSSLLEFDG